jgi:hypothetical protein
MLDTVPLARPLELKCGEVQTGLQHRLSLTVLPPNAPTVQCGRMRVRGHPVPHGCQPLHAMFRPGGTDHAAP